MRYVAVAQNSSQKDGGGIAGETHGPRVSEDRPVDTFDAAVLSRSVRGGDSK